MKEDVSCRPVEFYAEEILTNNATNEYRCLQALSRSQKEDPLAGGKYHPPNTVSSKTVTQNISEVCERAGLVQWNFSSDKTNEEPVLMKTNRFSESNIATKVEKLHATVQQKRKHLCKGRAVLFSGAGALAGECNTCFCQESRTQRSP